MKEQIKKKERLDNLIVKLGYAETKMKAQAFIMSGVVFIGNQRADKPGSFVKIDSEIKIVGEKPKYVSRGGLKLEKALNEFNIDVNEIVALDIGASTGGFTDCLLQFGASKVYAFDVGHGQLDWKIRNDKRVIAREKVNCRYLKPEDINEKVDLITIDVSFISLLKIVEPAISLLKENGVLIALIKPQFEVGKNDMEKGGIIKDKRKHKKVVDKITFSMNKLGLEVKNLVESPILGSNGNKEFLIHCIKTTSYDYEKY